MRQFLRLFLAAMLFVAMAPLALAAGNYPDRPIKLLVGFPPGQATDILARLMADRLSRALSQPIIVENRPGQGGSIALAGLAKSPADGYTMLLAATASLVTNPHLYKNVGYDAQSDFSPVGLIAEVPLVLVANPNAPFNTVGELIAYAKAQPGKLSYSSSGNGTLSHLAMELFKRDANISLAHIPYPGSLRAMTDLVAGNVLLGFDTVTVTAPQVEAKRLKAIAIASEGRISMMPDTPTMIEAGMPGFIANPWLGMLFPKGTPAGIVSKVNAQLRKALEDPGVQKTFLAIGAVVRTSTPEEFGSLIKSDDLKWGHIVESSGAKVD